MRFALALVVLASLAAALPSLAQDTAPAALLADDAGDAQFSVQGTPAGSASQIYPAVDLIGLSVGETTDAVLWTLEVADLRAGNEETGADGTVYTIAFAHNGRYFELDLYHTVPILTGSLAFWSLAASDAPGGPFADIWDGDAPVDLQADTYSLVVPREALADLDGAAPFPGRLLEGITVAASSAFSGAQVSGLSDSTVMPQQITDAMPEAGQAPGVYAIQVGVQQTGHAHLSSPEPFRASNGEATTFVYQVEASNLGEENDTFELTVSGAPARVDLVVPVPLLVIPAGHTLTVPVLATIPFGHQHGGLDQFLVELTSQSDPGSVGRLQMGIRYLAVPQPAGHHDTVWLHMPPDGTTSGGLLPGTRGFMNTLDQDERAGTGNYYAAGFSGSGTSFSSFWFFPLEPGLAMGLDVDGSRAGTISIPIGGTFPLMGATLSGSLAVSASEFGSDGVFLAGFTTAPVDIDANGRHTFEATLDPDGSARVPFEPGRNLFLALELEYQAVPSLLLGQADETPYVAPGGFVQVPLNEWHDDVDDALNAVGGPVLRPLGPQERQVNPGEALVFQAAMTNPTDQDIPVGFEVTGKNAQWATLPVQKMTLPAKGNVTVSLIVRPDAAALDGDRADLVLQVYPQEMPELRALLRLVAEVDTDSDLVDEAPLATELTKKESPVPPLLVVAALASALAVARRRR